MKRLTVASLVALVTLIVLCGAVVAQVVPEFKLGFKALADQLPADVVGTPIENEYFNLSNGNSEQHTTKGLMVWRKVDNWTAYTNGYMTWINGPEGVQSRLNADRFAWEKDPVVAATVPSQPTPQPPVPTAAPIPTPQPAPTAVPAAPTPAPAVSAPPPAPASISRDKASSALLKISDMAPGYETIAYGWHADGYLEAQYHTAGRNYRGGPLVLARISLYESPISAQEALDRVNSEGYIVLGAALNNVASAKALDQAFKLGPTGEQGADRMVFFRIGNCVARVRLYGYFSNTTMDQALSLAQLTANRLVAP